MGVIGLFDRGASLFPDRTCLIDASARRTYREVQSRSSIIARGLERHGLRSGDRIAMLSPNSVAAFEFMFGVYRSGCVFVPITALSHVDEASHILDAYGVSALGYDSKFSELVTALRQRCPAVAFIQLDDPSLFSGPEADDAVLNPPEDLDSVVSIYSTGGTTGRPKGVEFTSLTWDTMTANFLTSLPCDAHPVYLVATPMTHASGTISVSLFSQGATVVVLPGFDTAAVLTAIEDHRVTHLWLPPTAIYMLLEDPSLRRRDLASLQCFMYSAAPMAVTKLKECLRIFGPVMVQIWGQTEAPCFCTCLSQTEHFVEGPDAEKRLASCGRSMLLTPVAVMDENGRLLPPGEYGELVVRGNLVMRGYHGDPAATAETIVDGWLHSGDIGYRDEDGYFYIVDRMKEMLITGGINVFPSEVEQVILSHPAVQDCAVFGVPDEKWGEAVKAVITLKLGATAQAGEIIDLCKSKLGSVKSPKSVEIWDDLPRTLVGKVERKKIREQFWAGRDRVI